MKRLLIATLALLALSAPMAPSAQAVDDCPLGDAHGSYHAATYTVRHTTHITGGDIVAYQIWLKGESCVNSNGKISAQRWNRWKYVNGSTANAWVWRNWDPYVVGGGLGENHVFRRSVGNLDLCYVRVGCVGHAEPMIQVTMTNSYPWSDGFVREM